MERKKLWRKLFIFLFIYFTCFSYTYASIDNWTKILELKNSLHGLPTQKNNAFVYFWILANFTKTGKSKVYYKQADCEKMVYRILLTEFNDKYMAKDYTGITIVDDREYWIDAKDDEMKMLDSVCSQQINVNNILKILP